MLDYFLVFSYLIPLFPSIFLIDEVLKLLMILI